MRGTSARQWRVARMSSTAGLACAANAFRNARPAGRKTSSMPTKTNHDDASTHEFSLVVAGVTELTEVVMHALAEAGCDDATPTMRHGLLTLDFSRVGPTFKDALLGAIADVLGSGLPARVIQVDACTLVSQAEIARRIGRSRQLVHQYVCGLRGPGGSPPPVCALAERAPLWRWCAISAWLAEHGLLPDEERTKAAVIEAVNIALDRRHLPRGLLAADRRRPRGPRRGIAETPQRSISRGARRASRSEAEPLHSGRRRLARPADRASHFLHVRPPSPCTPPDQRVGSSSSGSATGSHREVA